MRDSELTEAIIHYIKKSYEQNRTAPSLRGILKQFKKEKLGFSDFYRIFSNGMPEVCMSVAACAAVSSTFFQEPLFQGGSRRF